MSTRICSVTLLLALAVIFDGHCAAQNDSVDRPDAEVPQTSNRAVRRAPTTELTLPVANAFDRTQLLAEDYRIGPQDLIEIQIYGLENLKREVRVNSRGVISLPLIGPITLGGLTAQEGEALITARYEKDYLRNPQVSLFIKDFTSQRITIEGAVQRPGVFPIKGQTSLLQALAIAGGGGPLSDMSEVMLFRTENGARKAVKYDVLKIRTGEAEDPMLLNDDLVVVNRSTARAALKDSLFRDILDTVNPFNWGR